MLSFGITIEVRPINSQNEYKTFLVCIAIIFIGASTLHAELSKSNTIDESKFEWFPLPAYDTDIGLGIGLKGFYLNPLGLRESFDLTLFGSTKGERWVRFVFSIPDFELRQGTIYDKSIDLIIDYDLMIKNSYFGVGPDSKFSDRIYYSKEPLDISLIISRGFTKTLVGQFGARYRSVNSYNIPNTDFEDENYRGLESDKIGNLSFFVNTRYDSRDSYINPKTGFCLSAELENIPKISMNDCNFSRIKLELKGFYYLEVINSVLAARFKAEWLTKENLPVQVLLSQGGNQTIRGTPLDRFLGNAVGLENIELRFPIYYHLGGIVALDAGRVWNSILNFNLNNWFITPVAGLRYDFDTYIIRGDIGFSRDIVCFYLNINHIF